MSSINLFLFAMMFFSPAAAESIAEDLLIDKFQKIKNGLADSDPTKENVSLRLADLLSERARRKTLVESESGCVDCNAGNEDRQKALRLYQDTVSKLAREKQPAVLLQIGHLHEMLGNAQEAALAYKRIISFPEAKPMHEIAWYSLGEMNFKARKWKEARENFALVAENQDSLRLGRAKYRIAWTHFQEGDESSAFAILKALIADPTQMRSLAGPQQDESFQEEVLRDYVIVQARIPVDENSLAFLVDRAPEKLKQDLLASLSGELERLGKKPEALIAWTFYRQRETSLLGKIHSNLRMAQLQLDLNEKSSATASYLQAMASWSELPPEMCVKSGEACNDSEKKARRYLELKYDLEKKTPSDAIESEFSAFLKLFPKDLESTIRSAEVSSALKLWTKALDRYLIAQTLLENSKDKEDVFETLLMKQIEVSESSGEVALKERAYKNYLEKTQKKGHFEEVSYQLGFLWFQGAEKKQGIEKLREIAVSEKFRNRDLKIKSANLVLDALALEKNETQLSHWAQVFAKQFHSQGDMGRASKEFLKIARLADLSLVARLANSNQDKNSWNEAWQKLNGINLEGAEPQELISIEKDKVLLSEKLGMFDKAEESVRKILENSQAKEAEKTFALERKLWLAEMRLNFGELFKVIKSAPRNLVVSGQKELMKDNKEIEKAYLLKVALIAELSGNEPAIYLKEFLRKFPEDDRSPDVVAKLFTLSKSEGDVLKVYDKVLRRKPILREQLLQEQILTYSPDRMEKALRSLTSKELENPASDAGVRLIRWKHLPEVQSWVTRLKSHQLQSDPAKLAKSLKERIRQLDEGEAHLKRFLQIKDPFFDIVFLGSLGAETIRFYNEVMTLPVPADLNESEQQQYLSQLAQTVEPFKHKSELLFQKYQDAISVNLDFLNSYTLTFAIAKPSEKDWLLREWRMLHNSFSEKERNQFAEKLENTEPSRLAASAQSPSALPTLAELEKKREQVRAHPMDALSLRELIEVEKKLGRETMVGYLTGRLAQMEASREGKN